MLQNQEELFTWVERLGGWGVVLLVVRWMMTRIDKLITNLETAIKSFQAFEAAEEAVHTQVVDNQKKLCDTQKELVTLLKQIIERLSAS